MRDIAATAWPDHRRCRALRPDRPAWCAERPWHDGRDRDSDRATGSEPPGAAREPEPVVSLRQTRAQREDRPLADSRAERPTWEAMREPRLPWSLQSVSFVRGLVVLQSAEGTRSVTACPIRLGF